MITVDEALKAIDPTLPEDQRVEQAGRLVASSAALDAYYDSRPQLEQIIAAAQGAGHVKSFAEINPEQPDAVKSSPAAAGSIEGSAVTDAEVVESEADQEIKQLEERVAALRAGKGS